MSAQEKSQGNFNALWLLPTAISMVGIIKDVSEFGTFVAGLCRGWMVFCRALWLRAFDLAPGAPVITDGASLDLLTLWVTISLAIWLLPSLSERREGRVQTTVQALHSLRLPTVLARILAFILIALSVIVIAFPFATLPSAENGETLIETLQTSGLVAAQGDFGAWLSSGGRWLAALMVAVGVVLFTFVFAILGPRLADAQLNREEVRDLSVIAAVLWVLSAALLVGAFFIGPQGVHLIGLTLVRQDLMVLSLLALAALVAWRSALPLVQLASFVVVIFAIDGVVRFVTELWQSSVGGS